MSASNSSSCCWPIEPTPLNVHIFLPALLRLSLLKENQRDLSSLKKKTLSCGIFLAFVLTDHESGNLKGKVCNLLQSSLNTTAGGTAFLENQSLYDLLSFEKCASVQSPHIKHILLIIKCLLK